MTMGSGHVLWLIQWALLGHSGSLLMLLSQAAGVYATPSLSSAVTLSPTSAACWDAFRVSDNGLNYTSLHRNIDCRFVVEASQIRFWKFDVFFYYDYLDVFIGNNVGFQYTPGRDYRFTGYSLPDPTRINSSSGYFSFAWHVESTDRGHDGWGFEVTKGDILFSPTTSPSPSHTGRTTSPTHNNILSAMPTVSTQRVSYTPTRAPTTTIPTSTSPTQSPSLAPSAAVITEMHVNATFNLMSVYSNLPIQDQMELRRGSEDAVINAVNVPNIVWYCTRVVIAGDPTTGTTTPGEGGGNSTATTAIVNLRFTLPTAQLAQSLEIKLLSPTGVFNNRYGFNVSKFGEPSMINISKGAAEYSVSFAPTMAKHNDDTPPPSLQNPNVARSHGEESAHDIGVIVGGIFGGLAALALIGVFIRKYCLKTVQRGMERPPSIPRPIGNRHGFEGLDEAESRAVVTIEQI